MQNSKSNWKTNSKVYIRDHVFSTLDFNNAKLFRLVYLLYNSLKAHIKRKMYMIISIEGKNRENST